VEADGSIAGLAVATGVAASIGASVGTSAGQATATGESPPLPLTPVPEWTVAGSARLRVAVMDGRTARAQLRRTRTVQEP